MKTSQSIKKKGALSILLALFVSGFPLPAQQRLTVSGTVLDETGFPAIGVGVVQKGTSNGTASDLEGRYSLSVPPGSVLVFSYIGYLSQEHAVPAGGGTLDVILEPDTQTLEETVVVGYGVQRKSDLTGSISSVKQDDLSNRTLTDPAQALQGKTAGVYISLSSGSPGAEGTVRIRGVGTNGNSRPLFVIDGSISREGISNLNPEDIESMEILKDGASTAIYGARAGNGVILVTTRRGAGEGRISYQMQTSLNTFGRLPKVMNSREFYEYYCEHGGIPQSQMDANWDGKTDTDWIAELVEPSVMVRHNLSFQKGDPNGNIFLSAQYMSNNGPMKGDRDTFKRLTVSVNGSWRFKPWLQLQTNNQLGVARMRSVGNGNFSNMVRLDPHTPAYYDTYDDLPGNLKMVADDRAQYGQLLQDARGRYYAIPFYTTLANPFLTLYGSEPLTKMYNLNGSTALNLMPFAGFTFTSRIGYRINLRNSQTTNFDRYVNGNDIRNYASVSASISMPTYFQWENFFNYSRTFGKHDFTGMAGMSYSQDIDYYISGNVTGSNSDYGFLDNARKYLYWAFRSGNATHTVDGAEPIYTRNLSYYGRINWNYDNRYIAQVSLRADAADSSVLPLDNRWGYFPAFSLGWTLSNERFWSDIKHLFPYVKVRASWGANGSTANLGSFSWASSMVNSGFYPARTGEELTDYQYIATYIPEFTGNKNLKWESSQQTDFGLDLRFLQNRLTFTADYYHKVTRDLIISGAKPSFSVGNVSSPINAGEITNSGFELEAGWQDKRGDFAYSIRGNLATLRNRVNAVDPSLKTVMGVGIHPRQGQTRFEAGYPAWHFYGFKFKEIDRADGLAVFYDKDGNETKEPLDADYTDLGSGLPKLTAGLTVNLEWRNWDLLLFASGAFGQKTYMFYDSPIGNYNKLTYFTADRWTPSNPDGTRPSAQAGNNYTNWIYSSANVVDSSYIKLKQIQLGYSLPESLLGKIRSRQLRFYLSLDNFFTFTRYPGYDPEVVGTGSGQGVDSGSYPLMRQAVFGLNLTF